MKALIISCAVAALTFLGPVTQADARQYRSTGYGSTYRSCATPLHTGRYIIGYDRYGRPLWGYRTIRSRYRPVARPHFIAPCPPPARHYGRSYSRSNSGSRDSFRR